MEPASFGFAGYFEVQSPGFVCATAVIPLIRKSGIFGTPLLVEADHADFLFAGKLVTCPQTFSY
jgi:hypothetical protein